MAEQLLTWRAPTRTVNGVQVWMPYAEHEECILAFEKLEKAIALLTDYSPNRLDRVHALRGIVIFGTTNHTARYLRDSNLCQVWSAFILAPETTPERLAITLVHEATHALLFRLGFGYEETIRIRIERICTLAELGVAKRLPNGAKEVSSLENHLFETNSKADWLSDVSFEDRLAHDFRQLRFPGWLVKIIIFTRACMRRITLHSKRSSKLAGEL